MHDIFSHSRIVNIVAYFDSASVCSLFILFRKIKYNVYNKSIPSCYLFLTDIKSIQGVFDNIMTVGINSYPWNQNVYCIYFSPNLPTFYT